MQFEWHIIGASVVGSGHITRRQDCQDSHEYKVLADGTLLIAVADGAGSARHSALGSRIAVNAAISFLSEAYGSQNKTADDISSLLRNAASIAREPIRSHCRSTQELLPDDNIHVAEFATTLVLIVINAAVCGLLQIGDGAVVAETPDCHFEVLTVPGNDEYINETTFLTSELSIENSYLRVLSEHSFIGIAAMTDGIQLLSVDHVHNKAFAPFFVSLFRYARSPGIGTDALATFLSSERVCERTDDDKTLVLAVR